MPARVFFTSSIFLPFTSAATVSYTHLDAENIIIAMGSVCDTIAETVDYLNAQGAKTGLVKVNLYRPFSSKYLLDVIPSTVKTISVIDRTKEPGSIGEPLYLDVIAAFKGSQFETTDVYKRQQQRQGTRLRPQTQK